MASNGARVPMSAETNVLDADGSTVLLLQWGRALMSAEMQTTLREMAGP